MKTFININLRRKARVKPGLLILAFCSLMLSGLPSCIKNDLPYPRLEQFITSIAAEGQSRDALIDSTDFKATVFLGETVDIQKVKFTKFSVTPGATSDPNLLEGTYDLSTPITVKVSRYQEYDWTVSAIQEIERYFTIAGQVGETTIDPVGHRIIVYMPETANLTSLTLTSIKLGPEGITTMTPDLKPGKINLATPLKVAVTAWNRTTDWTIYVEKVTSNVQTVSVSAWSEVAWVYGGCLDTMKGGLQYREADSDEWQDADSRFITQTGGTFYGYIPHLVPLQKYYFRATGTNGDGSVEYGEELEATTQGTAILPDGSFDQWCLGGSKGNMWQPWDSGGQRFWDTGNTGSITLGENLTTPTDHTVTGTGKAARLETKFVNIIGIGKLGSGSIFTGQYLRTDGTNGVLGFGRPWVERPTKLKGYFQYQGKTIDRASNEMSHMIGKPDSCHIYIALTDWTEPFEIRTKPADRQLFNPNSPSVIAYGELTYSGTMNEYQEFEIVLNYRDISRIPRYIQITCSASKYGDYFTGGDGSVLYLDNFTLHYDY